MQAAGSSPHLVAQKLVAAGRTGAEEALEAVGAGEAVRGAAKLGGKAFSGLVASKRFIKAVNDTFDEVDIDASGTIEKAELFVAILLLNHQVNKMPMVGRQEPPSRAEVDRVMLEHTSDGSLTREQFLRVCQDLMQATMKGMGFRFLTITVMSPLLALSFRKGLDRTVCRLLPWVGYVLGFIPDSLFIPFAASLLSAFTPILMDIAQGKTDKVAKAAAACEAGEASTGGATGAKKSRWWWDGYQLTDGMLVVLLVICVAAAVKL